MTSSSAHARKNAILTLQLDASGSISADNDSGTDNEIQIIDYTASPNANSANVINPLSIIQDTDNINTTFSNDNSKCYEITYWIARCFFVSASFCFTILTACYGISNITTINAINFFCPIYSAEQVYQHNIANNNTQGEDDTSCWVINRLRLNSVAVEDLNLGLYTAEIVLFNHQQSWINIMAFLIFCLMTMYSFIIGIKNFYYIIYDSIYFYILKKFNPRILKIQKKDQKKNFNKDLKRQRKVYRKNRNKNNKNHNQKEDTEDDTHSRISIKKRLGMYMCCMVKSYRRYFYDDSKYRIFKIMIGEIFEISIQMYGLLLYGGINLFDINNIPLAQEYYVILVFSFIIGLNCIFVGVGWMVYICGHNTCHGTLFFSSLFFIDTIFDMMYVIFPLIYLTSYQNEFIFSLRRLGLLRQSNPFVLVQVLSATLFSIRKINKILTKLDPAYIEHCYLTNIQRVKCGTYMLRKPWIMSKEWKRFHQTMMQLSHRRGARKLRPSLFLFVDKLDGMIQQRFQIHTAADNTSIDSSINSKPSAITVNNVQDALASISFEKSQTKQKVSVLLCGLMFIIVGCAQMAAVAVDIRINFLPKCVDNNNINSTDLWMENHHEIELIYSPFCTKKVVNLFESEYPCNCRQFKIDSANVQQDLKLAQSIVSELPNAFQRWTMLEAFYIYFDESFYQSLPIVNFTAKELNLKYLRIFNSIGLSIGSIDSSIDKLMKRLEILKIMDSYANLYLPWKSINNISSINAIHLEDINEILVPFDDSICQLKNLRYLEFRNNRMINSTAVDIPDCIENNWDQLQYIRLSFLFSNNDAYVSPALYNLENIRSIEIFSWPFNTSSFVNFTGYNKNNLKRDNNSYIWFSSSDICGHNNNDQTWLDYISIDSDNQRLASFIKEFDPCFEPCGDITDSNGCNAFSWGDGICDTKCFNQRCGWDNGDCTQLCHCQHNQTLISLLYNNECDVECDTNYCENDYFACGKENSTCNDNPYNITNDGNYNLTNIDELIINQENDACFNGWIASSDGWCDDNCRNLESCNYDNDACLQCDANCHAIYTIFVNVAQQTPHNLVITQQETCDYWSIIQSLAPQVAQNFTNCTNLFDYIDTNQNNMIGFHEMIVAFALQNLLAWTDNYRPDLKIKQVNCSKCIEGVNLTLYFL